ncbi:MAG: aminoglycoside phosphotransferase family protein [Beduini sp.]|uniref:aminoglycoside phosphotransferase family protein n=1 Tax=Beduini sp. TaxID=1922300 RepID=UPI0011C88214
MDDQAVIYNIAKEYKLGPLTKEPERLYGGFLHKNYLLVGSSSKWVVKMLNPEIMKRKEAFANYDEAERLEQVLEENELPIVSALTIHQHKRQWLAGHYFYIFPYFNGNALSFGAITKKHCCLIGQTLANIHSLKTIQEPVLKVPLSIDWSLYIQDQQVLSKLKRWHQYYELAALLPPLKTICHNDLDPKNVLWNKFDLKIIDLECLQMASPYLELLETALCWAGYEENFKVELFDQVIEAYYEFYRLPEIDWKIIYYHNFKNKLEWLAYNLTRLQSSNLEERKLGRQETEKTWKNLCTYETLENILLTHLKALT